MNTAIYFNSKIHEGPFPHESLPIALFLWDKLKRNLDAEFYIYGTCDYYDDLQLMAYARNGKKFFSSSVRMVDVKIDLNYYKGSPSKKFSLAVNPKYKNRKVKTHIMNILKDTLENNDVFFDVGVEEIENP